MIIIRITSVLLIFLNQSMVQNDQKNFTVFTYVLVNDTQILHKNDDNKSKWYAEPQTQNSNKQAYCLWTLIFFASYKNNFHKTLVYANACLLGTQHYECLPLLCDVLLLPCSQLQTLLRRHREVNSIMAAGTKCCAEN